jgi:hypothetical protein
VIVQTMESENTISIACLAFIVEIGCRSVGLRQKSSRSGRSFVLALIVLSSTGCLHFEHHCCPACVARRAILMGDRISGRMNESITQVERSY